MKKDNEVSEELKEELEEAQKEYVDNILSEEGQKSIEDNETIESLENDELLEDTKVYEDDNSLDKENGAIEIKEDILQQEPNNNENINTNNNKYKGKIIALSVAICIVFVAIIGVLIDYKKEGIFNFKDNDIKSGNEVEEKIQEQENIINSWTDEQKKIFGLNDEEIKEQEQQEIIDKKKEESKTQEYKEYEKLSDEEKEKQEVIPRKEEVPYEDLNKIKKQQEEKQEEDLPAKFDLRDAINIKVEDQQQFGLCWDFASSQSVQTHMALVNKKEVDVAEIHADYLLSKAMYGTRDIHTGGNFRMYEDYLKLTSPVNDKVLSYRDYSEIKEYDYFLDIDKEDFNVTEVVKFPNLYKKYNETDEEYSARRNEIVTQMKKHIKNNGSLYITIVTPDSDRKYFNSNTYSQYYNGDSSLTNPNRLYHAVSIVGWDDNYSKENFNSELKPKNDGAFIVLNSWSEFWGNEGYFYISYEDESVYIDVNGVVSTSLEDAYNVNDIKNKKIRNIIDEKLGYSYINKNGNKYVTKLALSNITQLDLSNSDITDEDIKDISMFSNVVNLDLSNNKITDISPLKSLKKLGYLDLSDNSIEDISPIKDCTELYNIYAKNNNIKDVSSLKDLRLMLLDISGNTGVTGFEQISNLSHLILRNTNTSLENISQLKMLYSLDLSDNNSIEGLTLPDSISSVVLHNCNIESISEIPYLEIIHTLNLSNNKLSSLEGIEKAKGLYTLNLSNNPGITDYSLLKPVISTINSIDDYKRSGFVLTAENNGISDISMFNDMEIASLSLGNNKISDLSSYNNKYIKTLDLSGNKNISNIEKLSSVETLILENCGITSVDDISKLKLLVGLDLSNNDIKDITPLSELPKLNFLSLNENKNISGKIDSDSIVTLNIRDCNLKEFDISKMPKLDYLEISNNKEFTDIYSLIKNSSNKFIYIRGSNITIDEEQISKINQIDGDNPIYLHDFQIKVSLKRKNNYYDLKDSYIRTLLMKNITDSWTEIKNLDVDSKVTRATIKDSSKLSQIEVLYVEFDKVSLSSMKLIFN